jgi:hypothetical protein
LEGFKICPVVSRACLTCRALSRLTLKKKNVSSANNRCDIPWAQIQNLIGDISLASIPLFKIADNPSATKKNNNKDKGSPCRSPHVGTNESKRVPLNFTEYLTTRHYPVNKSMRET